MFLSYRAWCRSNVLADDKAMADEEFWAWRSVCVFELFTPAGGLRSFLFANDGVFGDCDWGDVCLFTCDPGLIARPLHATTAADLTKMAQLIGELPFGESELEGQPKYNGDLAAVLIKELGSRSCCFCFHVDSAGPEFARFDAVHFAMLLFMVGTCLEYRDQPEHYLRVYLKRQGPTRYMLQFPSGLHKRNPLPTVPPAPQAALFSARVIVIHTF